MPREKKKRGRREERKTPMAQVDREEDQFLQEELPPSKRRKSTEDDYIPVNFGYESAPQSTDTTESPFYGLLDQEEQDYFKRADNMLVANQFPSAEEQILFIESVWKEAAGKELKIACSQSCSRMLERLIGESNASQLKELFRQFDGHFLHLVQHRFASHCCEALFLKSALVVAEETKLLENEKFEQKDNEEEFMDTYLLRAIDALQSNLGYLLTERFASHTLRVLLVVLSGERLDHPVLASKKKESTAPTQTSAHASDPAQHTRPIPVSFNMALDKFIRESISGLDATYLRALATHPTGNPTLQLLLSIELSHHRKGKREEGASILVKVLPDDNLEEGTESYSFLKGILYDPVGSRLLETIVQYASGKIFKKIHASLFKDRFGSIARNDTAGFVAIRVLERLGREDLEAAMTSILADAPALVQRAKLSIFKALIERCEVRGVNTEPICETFRREDVFGGDPHEMILSLLGPDLPLENQTLEATQRQRHGTQLAQTMIQSSRPLGAIIFEGLLDLNVERIVRMARTSTTSRLVQDAVTASSSNLQFRRKFLPIFTGHLCGLALDARGSHLIDALWPATDGLMFLKERFAQELAEGEADLRESYFGRAVWKNWQMDVYIVRKDQWLGNAKEHSRGLDRSPAETRKPISAIDQARARFASQVAQKQRQDTRYRMAASRG